MLDVLLRSIGLDQNRLMGMVNEASAEYQKLTTEFRARLTAIEETQSEILATLKEMNHGNAALGSDERVPAILASAECIDAAPGTIQPIDGGRSGGNASESANVDAE